MNKIFSLVGVKRTICKGKLNIVEKKANSGSRLAFGESVVEFGETNRENLRWPAQIREFVEISIICPNFHVCNWKSWQTNNEFTAVPPIPRPQNCSGGPSSASGINPCANAARRETDRPSACLTMLPFRLCLFFSSAAAGQIEPRWRKHVKQNAWSWLL